MLRPKSSFIMLELLIKLSDKSKRKSLETCFQEHTLNNNQKRKKALRFLRLKIKILQRLGGKILRKYKRKRNDVYECMKMIYLCVNIFLQRYLEQENLYY